MRSTQKIFSGQASGSRHLTGGPVQKPKNDDPIKRNEGILGGLHASQGVPDFGENHDGVVHSARLSVCSSPYVRSFPEGDRAEIVRVIFEALGLDEVSQKRGSRKQVSPGESFCNQEGNGHSGDARSYHAT